jgi:integrase
MTEITKLEMQAHFSGLLETGPGWYTVMKIRNYLSAVFSRAIELDCGIKLNPVSAIDLGSAPGHSDPVNLTDEQIVAIEEGLTDPVVKTLWWLTSVIGYRKGEGRALRLGSIDWEHGKLWIKESRFEGQTVPPKTAKGKRAVDLSPAQLTRLAEYCRLFPKATAEDFLFPSRQRRIKAPRCMKNMMNKVIKPVARKLGIQKVGWQMLRRWNSTVMNEESFSDKVRQVRLGHASPMVTNDHYTYVRDSVSRRAGEAIDDRLEEARKKNSPESVGTNVGTPEEVCV